MNQPYVNSHGPHFWPGPKTMGRFQVFLCIQDLDLHDSVGCVYINSACHFCTAAAPVEFLCGSSSRAVTQVHLSSKLDGAKCRKAASALKFCK